jgi:uncharacterized protein (DUF697 family)
VDEEELAALKKMTEEALEGVAHFDTCCLDDSEIQNRLNWILEWDALLNWATLNLDDALKEGFVSSLEGSLDQKKSMVLGKIIPLYTAAAAGIAAAPIPFADALVLIPLQIKMSIHIMSAFGLNRLSGVESRAIESFIVAQAGRLIARTVTSNLVKFIPVVGWLVGAAINATVAGSFTHVMGGAVCDLCYRYSRDVVIEGRNVSVADAFSSAALLENLV